VKKPLKLALIRVSMILLIGFIAVLAVGCTAPPPPPTPEPTIPLYYTTYTSEGNLFSISYPPNWETDLSSIPDVDKNSREVISSMESGLPVEKYSSIFLATRRTATGYENCLNINVGPIPNGVLTHDQLVEANLRALGKLFPDYRLFSRVETTVGGRKATILDWEGAMQGQSAKTHVLTMLTLVDKTVWTVTGIPGYEDVVRSLRITK
jgi:hypothetical protein